MTLPWRKRLEYTMLRWQARLETIQVDRFGPWFFFALLWLALSLFAMARSRELSQGEDFASALQSVWLIQEGFKPESSLLGHNLLFEQAAYLIYPVAWLTRLFPAASTLLILQAGALALGVVPLWRIARRVALLRVGTSAAILLAYSFYAAVHAMNAAGFHVETLALPALLGAIHRGFRDQWVRYTVLIAVVLAARADLSLAVVGLGVLWAVEGKQRLALYTGAVGVVWLLLALFVIQPSYASGLAPHLDAFSDYGDGNLGSVLWGIISAPGTFLSELFSQGNFRSLVTLLAPVGFLPLVAPRYLLPVVPLYALYLVADVPEGVLLESQQVVPVTAFIFVATVFAVARTGRVLVERVNVDRRVVIALLLAAAVFFVRDSVTSPYAEPWSWGRRGAVDGARLDAADLVPDGEVVRASSRLLPLLTERTGLFPLDTSGAFNEDVAVTAADAVEWIIFDSSEAPDWDSVEVQRFGLGLTLLSQWECAYSNEGIQVFRLPKPGEVPLEAAERGCDPPVDTANNTGR